MGSSRGDDGRRGGGRRRMERARIGEPSTRGRRPTPSEGRRRLGRRARERTFSGTRSACSSAGLCWRTRTSLPPRRRGGRGFRRADVRHRAPGGRGRPSRARRARAVSDLPTPPPGGGRADGPGRSMAPAMARGALSVMKKTRTTRVCGTKTTRPERLSRDLSISPDSNVSGGVALQFVRFPSGRGGRVGVHDRARSCPRARARGLDADATPRTPRVDRAEALASPVRPFPQLLAGARSSIDPVVVAYGLLRGACWGVSRRTVTRPIPRSPRAASLALTPRAAPSPAQTRPTKWSTPAPSRPRS